MNKKILLITIIAFLTNLAFAQDKQKYIELKDEAWKLYENKQYQESGLKYSEAFVAFGNRGMVDDRYNAACSWALAGRPDSAFVQLYKIAQKGNYTNLKHIEKDTDLSSLHADPRWTEVIAIIKSNKEKAEASFDKVLVAILDTILKEDQKYRMEIDEVEKRCGRDSEEMKAHFKLINKIDSLNLVKVKKILNERGWLAADIIGQQGNLTLFLVIQHADLETQVHYLPMMREAVRKGNADASNLALLEDRVALRQGKRQIYGSQIGRDPKTGEYYVSPLKDPDNVDQRREEVGLGKLENYISNWGITWNVEEYKRKLVEIEAKEKSKEY